MPAHGKLRAASKQSTRAQRSVLWLILVLGTSCPALVGTLVNPSRATETHEFIAGSGEDIEADSDGASVVVGRDAMTRPTGVDTSGPAAREILKEVGKQAIEQPGHFVVGAVPIWVSRCLLGVPWYGWVVTPLLAYREWLQWPSKRWWDPPLDWAFLTLGAVTATWGRRSGRGRIGGLAEVSRNVARAISVGSMRRGGAAPEVA